MWLNGGSKWPWTDCFSFFFFFLFPSKAFKAVYQATKMTILQFSFEWLGGRLPKRHASAVNPSGNCSVLFEDSHEATVLFKSIEKHRRYLL